MKYQPSGAGGTHSPSVMPHRQRGPKILPKLTKVFDQLLKFFFAKIFGNKKFRELNLRPKKKILKRLRLSWAKLKLSQKFQFQLESKLRLKLKLNMEFSYQPVGWVGGWTKTKLTLNSAQVEVEVEVGVELGNRNKSRLITLDLSLVQILS